MKNKSASGNSIKATAKNDPNPETRDKNREGTTSAFFKGHSPAGVGRSPNNEMTTGTARVPDPKPGSGRHH